MAYLVEPSATSERFTVVLLYVPGDAYPGQLTVHFKDESSMDWVDADRGDRHDLPKFTATRKMVAPITIKVEGTYVTRGDVIPVTWSVTAADVIPVGWHGGKTYYAA
uniref:Expansin-like CBD domain-containing protein n=1 Tax=Triticum urartu TaxID=4572 RepID=A0A8R7U4D3_TRIUA